jgi:hypothetical protein
VPLKRCFDVFHTIIFLSKKYVLNMNNIYHKK